MYVFACQFGGAFMLYYVKSWIKYIIVLHVSKLNENGCDYTPKLPTLYYFYNEAINIYAVTRKSPVLKILVIINLFILIKIHNH